MSFSYLLRTHRNYGILLRPQWVSRAPLLYTSVMIAPFINDQISGGRNRRNFHSTCWKQPNWIWRQQPRSMTRLGPARMFSAPYQVSRILLPTPLFPRKGCTWSRLERTFKGPDLEKPITESHAYQSDSFQYHCTRIRCFTAICDHRIYMHTISAVCSETSFWLQED